MLKLLIFSLGVLLSVSTFSNEGTEILLRAKKIDLGRLMGEEVTLVDKEIKLVRDNKSPSVVTIKLDYSKLKKSCVEYKLKSKTKKAISVNSCEKINSGSSKEVYSCEKKSFDSFDILRRVCSKKGNILKNVTKKIKVVFMRSVKLAPEAKEVFSIKINQKKISSSNLKLEGKVESSASLYKVNNIFNSILEFKAR